MLKNIRVLDLSRILSGPYCSQLLGDLGATVIKIEDPKYGDVTRQWGPPFTSTGHSSYFLSLNRNKQSIAVDLKSKKGIDIIDRLVKSCDILVENFIPGKMEEDFDLGYDRLSKINPRLIYCSMSGFGSKGALKDKPGFDIIVSAMYGAMSITGNENSNVPVKNGVAITDITTGLFAQQAILAALYERSVSGKGQLIETSLMESQLATLINVGSNYLTTNIDNSKRYGTAHPSIVPYQSFECKDKQHIVIGIGTDNQFLGLCDALDLSHLKDDSRFKKNKHRVENRVALVEMINNTFLEKTRKEWEEIFDHKVHKHLPFGPVRTIKEAFDCEQAVAMNMINEVTHPVYGKVKVCGNPVKYSRFPVDQSDIAAPPLLGEHTVQILKDLDYDDSQIRQMIDDNVISIAVGATTTTTAAARSPS